MIYRSRFILFVLFTLIVYCAPRIRSADTRNQPLYVKYGTDGGRCAGYCRSEITFKPGLLECLDQSPLNPERYPPKSKDCLLATATGTKSQAQFLITI
jgi:hypothetical protein